MAEGKKAIEGTGGDFSYYELGEPLLISDCLNEAVSIEKIREYIWFMETKSPYVPVTGNNRIIWDNIIIQVIIFIMNHKK